MCIKRKYATDPKLQLSHDCDKWQPHFEIEPPCSPPISHILLRKRKKEVLWGVMGNWCFWCSILPYLYIHLLLLFDKWNISVCLFHINAALLGHCCSYLYLFTLALFPHWSWIPSFAHILANHHDNINRIGRINIVHTHELCIQLIYEIIFTTCMWNYRIHQNIEKN